MDDDPPDSVRIGWRHAFEAVLALERLRQQSEEGWYDDIWDKHDYRIVKVTLVEEDDDEQELSLTRPWSRLGPQRVGMTPSCW